MLQNFLKHNVSESAVLLCERGVTAAGELQISDCSHFFPHPTQSYTAVGELQISDCSHPPIVSRPYKHLILNSTSGPPMVCMECLRGTENPPPPRIRTWTEMQLSKGWNCTAVRPPPLRCEVELGCSDCSWTPPPKLQS